MNYHEVNDDEIARVLTVLAEQNRSRVPTWHRCPVDEIPMYRPCIGVWSEDGAAYNLSVHEIGFGTRIGEHDVIHEFTHYLVADQGWRARTNTEAHGEPFYRALRDVVRRYYRGDETLYLWRDEYNHIQAWAIRDGLMSPADRAVMMM